VYFSPLKHRHVALTCGQYPIYNVATKLCIVADPCHDYIQKRACLCVCAPCGYDMWQLMNEFYL